jgi:hypothetical protein
MMTKTLFAVAFAACRAAPNPAPAPAPAPAACDVAGTWELTIDGTGCPIGERQVTFVDGASVAAPAPPNTAAMSWTLRAALSSSGACEIELRGSAGRLFHVVAQGTRNGNTLVAIGHSESGDTRFGCGGDVSAAGVHRR